MKNIEIKNIKGEFLVDKSTKVEVEKTTKVGHYFIKKMGDTKNNITPVAVYVATYNKKSEMIYRSMYQGILTSKIEHAKIIYDFETIETKVKNFINDGFSIIDLGEKIKEHRAIAKDLTIKKQIKTTNRNLTKNSDKLDYLMATLGLTKEQLIDYLTK